MNFMDQLDEHTIGVEDQIGSVRRRSSELAPDSGIDNGVEYGRYMKPMANLGGGQSNTMSRMLLPKQLD